MISPLVNSSALFFKNFIKIFLISFFAMVLAILAFVVIVDPFNFFSFHNSKQVITMLPFNNDDENPIDDRYAVNAMIKSKKYDGAIFGSSVSYIIEGKPIGDAIGKKIANFSMRAALPYEQIVVARRFLQFNNKPSHMIFFISNVWCDQNSDTYALRDPGGPIPEKDFPMWLFDKNPLNEFSHIFNLKVIQFSFKKIKFFIKNKKQYYSIYDSEGSSQYPTSNYVKPIAEVREILSKGDNHLLKTISKKEYDEILKSGEYSRIKLLGELLSELPSTTVKILVFPPRYYSFQPRRGSREDALITSCKQSVKNSTADIENIKIIDFLKDDKVSRDDYNFWDSDHFNYNVARKVINPSLINAVKDNKR